MGGSRQETRQERQLVLIHGVRRRWLHLVGKPKQTLEQLGNRGHVVVVMRLHEMRGQCHGEMGWQDALRQNLHRQGLGESGNDGEGVIMIIIIDMIGGPLI